MESHRHRAGSKGVPLQANTTAVEDSIAARHGTKIDHLSPTSDFPKKEDDLRKLEMPTFFFSYNLKFQRLY